jgi:hypothetical protein
MSEFFAEPLPGYELMTLTLRPSGPRLRHRGIGRINQTLAVPTVALVLVANRQRSDDARGSDGDVGRGQGAAQKSWDEWKAWAKLEETNKV